MNTYDEEETDRINLCRELYIHYGGGCHEQIEADMRAMGYTDFHRRRMHGRNDRGNAKQGWIDMYGWNSLLREYNRNKRDHAWQAEAEDKRRATLFTAKLAEAATKAAERGVDTVVSSHQLLPVASRRRRYNVAFDSLPDFDEFRDWLKIVSPGQNWTFKHHVYICKHLKRVIDGECKRLMIFMPPRHGKSELVTVRFAAWYLKQHPDKNVIIGSYGQKLANGFSRKVKNVLIEDASITARAEMPPSFEVEKVTAAYASVATEQAEKKGCTAESFRGDKSDSSFALAFQRPKNTEAAWETGKGGGLRAVGCGAGVTGFGANLVVIDDPVKSRADAESQTQRDNVWNWYKDDIYTRLEPDAAVILIQTRWHDDDLAGRLLRESDEEGGEPWEIINLPAIAEHGTAGPGTAGALASNAGSPGVTDVENDQAANTESPPQSRSGTVAGEGACVPGGGDPVDPLGRAPGEALWPERFDVAALERIRKQLGANSFSALYQQHPSPAEGGLFKRSWFQIVSAAPPGLAWNRGTDPGISGKASADYTASFRVGRDEHGNIYIDGGYRRQIEYPKLRKYILGRIEAEKDTRHGIEKSANGNAILQDLKNEASGLGRALIGVDVKTDKVSRALPWIAAAEQGSVFLVRGPWNQDFIDEAAAFPVGHHDDQIDAVSIAFHMGVKIKDRSLYRF